MEVTERHVRTWMASEKDEEVNNVVSDISSGETTILYVVKALGEYLTSEEDELRRKGVDLLSSVLATTPHEKLNRQSTRVLSSFLCSKLEDPVTTVPALRGLVSLTKTPAFTSNEASAAFRALVSHVKMKSLSQSHRFLVFSIVDTLMARHRNALKDMAREFLDGYISLAEGEKDPRNLLLAFALARVILIEFGISNHVEGLYDITFCYFPITFRPPPNDPYGITTEDLKKALLECLNATPLFGPMGVPLFLEKLTVGSPTTKRDTLEAMRSCLPIYGAALANNQGKKIWNTLKLEIFQPVDSKTAGEALETMKVLIDTIYLTGTTQTDEARSPDTPIEGLAKQLCEECLELLKEPEKSQAKPAVKVLCALVSATPSVSDYVISRTVRHLVRTYLNPEEVASRPACLRHLNEIILSVNELSRVSSELSVDSPLLFLKDDVLGVLMSGMKSGVTRLPALEGLRAAVDAEGLMTSGERALVAHEVSELLRREDELGDEPRDTIVALLSALALKEPRHIEEQILPLLFSSLPDSPPARSANFERVRIWDTLSALSRICVQSNLFETLVVRLLTKLDLICTPSSTSTSISTESVTRSEGEMDGEERLERGAAYAHSMLVTLRTAFEEKILKGEGDGAKYVDQVTGRLFNLLIFSAEKARGRDGGGMIANNERLVDEAGRLVETLVRAAPSKKQIVFLGALFKSYLEDDAQELAVGQHKIPAEIIFQPFGSGAPRQFKNLVALFCRPIVSLRREVPLPTENLSEFLDMLIFWYLDSAENALQSDSILDVVSSVVNKKTKDLENFLKDKLARFWSMELAAGNVLFERRKKALRVWLSITRGLLVQNHPRSSSFVDKLFEVFGDNELSWLAARSIGEALEISEALSKKNHAVIKVLYAQKMINEVLPRIIEGVKTSEAPQTKAASLVALASLVKAAPKSTYIQEMPQLFPLLLRSLELDDENVRASVIDTFLASSEAMAQSVITEHASTLVNTMMKNAVASEMPSIRVRTNALRYLGVLPDIVRYDILHPYKANVLKKLAKALDDPKGSVRKEAVGARTKWFRYNG